MTSTRCPHPLRVFLALVLCATLGAGLAAARDLDAIVASGELVVLTFPHQESIFSRTNLDKGTPMPRLGGYSDFEGIDIDLMNSFAESLGVELRIRPVSEPRYSALIPDLLDGKGDLIASSLTITAERSRHVDFSQPYFRVYPVIVTPRDSTLESVDELGQHVGVVTAGSSHEQRLLRMGLEPASLVRVDFSIESFAALLEGDADYTLADSSSAQRFIAQEPQLKVAFRIDGQVDEYGFAVPQDSPELLDALDRFLQLVHSNGEIERVLAKHIAGLSVGPSPSGVMQASE